MIHRLFTAPQRWMPCAQPLPAETPQQDRFDSGETAVRRAPDSAQLRAIAEGRVTSMGTRAEQGLTAAEAAQARGDSIWPWLEALPPPTSPSQSRRWAALVQRDTEAAPLLAENPVRMRLWFEAAWKATDYAPGLARWLAERAPSFPVLPATFVQLATQAADPVAQAALGELFARVGAADRAALLGGGDGDGDQDAPCMPPAARDALVRSLPETCHPLIAQAWLSDPQSALSCLGALDVDVAGHMPGRRPLSMLNALICGYTPGGNDCAAYSELSLVTRPDAPTPAGLAPWAEALLAQPANAGSDAQLLHAQRAKALGKFLFACRGADVAEPTRAKAAPAVAALLALPDEALRRDLLWRLAGALGDPAQAAPLLALIKAVPAKALPLRLAAQLAQAASAAEPGLLAVLQARGLFAHGAQARCLMRLMVEQNQALYARQVLALTGPAHLRRVVDGPAHAQVLDAALQAAQEAAAAEGHERKTALGRLDKHQAQSRALATARLHLQPPNAPGPQPPPPKGTLEALRRAFAWLAAQPGLAHAAGPAARLCAPRELCAPQAQAVLSRCEAALAAPRPAADKWQAAWCASLLGDLRSLASRAAAPTPAYPSPAVRAVLLEHVVPLMLALAEYAPLVRATQRSPADFVQAQDVLPSSLQWTGLAPQPLRALLARAPDLSYVATYQSNMLSRWCAKDGSRGQTLLKKLLHAMAHDRLDAERRKGTQARKLLRQPGGAALLQAWERCDRAAATLPGHTIEDTGEPGAMLAAVTDIRSCQSARDGMRNQGMLGRLSDGAKRMVVLRDAGGKLRARAMLRLMRSDEGRPVLLLSPLYVATGTSEADAEAAMHAHVVRRAAQLGVQAVCKFSSQDAALPVAMGIFRLISESAPRDYWDELGDSNTTEPVVFCETLRELAPAP